ncbi:MAG TPA: response regulator [Fibrobacteria bacterium]|nr:response regulator [Fibrobacteria bacterium]
MMKKPPPRLLIVDDEAPQLQALCHTLQDEGFEVHGFSSPEEALGALQTRYFDLLLTDLRMPGMDGMSLLRSALRLDADLVVIIMTGHGTIDSAVQAMKDGALDFILKPFKLKAIAPILDRALSVRKLRTENKALAKHVAERTAELEAANNELEAFSYSVSHDLRAPLRHMNGFVKLLFDKFSAEIPADAGRYLNTIAESAQRMERLIDDLLRLSRVGRAPLLQTPVDLHGQACQVLEELIRDAPGRKIDLQVGDLPLCLGDPALLRQVLVNLLSNAFKFTGKKEAARIEIGYRSDGEPPCYFVRDNGAGFEMEYAQDIFGVFKRLHSPSEFEGTGVGLSIVQRIIRRHGGNIWAEAAKDQGATFYFTLPAAGV